jgi:hypothetical protein
MDNVQQEQDMNTSAIASVTTFDYRSLTSYGRTVGWALRLGIASASVLLFASVGRAQVAVTPVNIGVGGYGDWGGVGTAESSAAHGYADYIRAEGYYNMATAQSLIYAEQARAQYLQNRSVAYQGYWAGKEQRSAIDAQKRESSRHSAEALMVAGKYNAPQPLGAELLNPQTGKVVWPKALLDNKYAGQRAEIEKLFELRTMAPSGPNNPTKIQAATGELARLLKNNIASTSATDYMKARKFLDSLAVSAS